MFPLTSPLVPVSQVSEQDTVARLKSLPSGKFIIMSDRQPSPVIPLGSHPETSGTLPIECVLHHRYKGNYSLITLESINVLIF